MGQLSIAEDLINQGFASLLLSQQTDANLVPAVKKAKAAGIPVLSVNDAAIPSAENYVGNVQKRNGVNVTNWFITNRPEWAKSR